MNSMKKSNGAILKLEFPLARWRYLVMFQSLSQLQSWIVIVLACSLLVQSVAMLMGEELMPLGLLIFSIGLGSLTSVAMVMPVQFSFSSKNKAAMHTALSQLDVFRYAEKSRTSEYIDYKQKLPDLLRWKEGTIRIHLGYELNTISGPYIIVKKIRNLLSKVYGNHD